MVELSPTQFLGGPPPLGEILVSQGLIQNDQLFEALAYKDEHGLFLGQALVALRFVTEEDLVRALRSQQRFEAIHLTPDIVDPAVAEELGYEKCSEYGCIPINRIADHVTIAMENPSNLLTVQELTGLMKARLLPVFAEPRRIQEALRVHFGRTVSQMSGTELARRIDQLVREASITVGEGSPLGEPAIEHPLVVELVEALLEESFGMAVEALHIEARAKGLSVRYRKAYELEERCVLPLARAHEIVGRLGTMAGLSPAAQGPLDGRIHCTLGGKEVELCFTSAQGLHGSSAVVTFNDLPRTCEDLETTGLTPEQLKQLGRLCSEGAGLILAAGPVRSGKTTLMHGLLKKLSGPTRKLITVEETATRALDGVLQLTCCHGGATPTAAGLKSALRLDPDVVFVEELVDSRTATLASQAAATGRLVLSTTNTLGALETLDRMRELDPAPRRWADALRGIVGMRLVRRLCPACKVKAKPTEAQAEHLGEELHDTELFSVGAGCAECRDSGYAGHVGIFEVLELTPELRALITAGASWEELSARATEDGFADLRTNGLQAAREGSTSLSEVLASTNDGDSQ